MRRLLQTLSVACFVSVAAAQVAPIRQGSFELGGFVGASYGVTEGAIMGGGNVSYAVTKGFLPYVEYSYFPTLQRTATGTIGNTTNTYSATYPATGSDFHVGVHYRIPIRESHFAPYGVFGVGVLRVGDGTITNLTFTDANGTHTDTTPKTAPGGSNLAINFGGGVRYYVTTKYGFRVEVKGYKPFNGQQAQTGFGPLSFNNTFLKAEVGFFIQLR